MSEKMNDDTYNLTADVINDKVNCDLIAQDKDPEEIKKEIIGMAKKIREENMKLICPKTGSFIGWKKCVRDKRIIIQLDNGEIFTIATPFNNDLRVEIPLIVKLLIPEDAKRTNAYGSRKCRCDKAVVLEVQDIQGNVVDFPAYSLFYYFVYVTGKTVESEKPFCEDRSKECASGIHFFMTREEAVKFNG